MKTLLSILLLLVTSFAQGQTTPTLSPIQKAHKDSHRIKMQTLEGGSVGICSATAIGPHALLTATHCNAISAVVTVDGKDAEIMGITSDGLDHSILFLRGVTFSDYAEVDLTNNQQQADQVFVFGNPNGLPDIFRNGYVAGFEASNDEPERGIDILLVPKQKPGNAGVKVTYYDFNGFFGDSGSGVYNKDGKVIAVVSFIIGDDAQGMSLKFMGSYQLRLTKEDVAKAQAYVPPVAPPSKPVEKKHNLFDFLIGEK